MTMQLLQGGIQKVRIGEIYMHIKNLTDYRVQALCDVKMWDSGLEKYIWKPGLIYTMAFIDDGKVYVREYNDFINKFQRVSK